MPDIELTAAERRRSLAAATGCISVVGLTTGLTWPLLALALDSQGVDSRLIGLSSAVQALAILVISPLAPRLITRFGLVPTIYGCIAATVAALLLALYKNVYAWFPLRFLLGAAVSTIFIAGETWVIRLATPATRGRVVGIFGFVWSAAFASGPLIISVTGIEGWLPFLAGIAIVGVATLPLPFARGVAPTLDLRRMPGGIGRLFRAAPATLLAVLMLGMLDAVNDSFLPLYGTHSGLDETTAVTMLTVLLAGTTIIQLPLGWLADRLPVRRLLIAVIVLILLGWAAIPATIGTALLWPVLLLGCAVGGLWTVSLILVGERFEGADIAAANTARSVLYGLGAFAGPALAGVALEWWDPQGVPLVVIVGGLLYLPVALLAERRPRR